MNIMGGDQFMKQQGPKASADASSSAPASESNPSPPKPKEVCVLRQHNLSLSSTVFVVRTLQVQSSFVWKASAEVRSSKPLPLPSFAQSPKKRVRMRGKIVGCKVLNIVPIPFLLGRIHLIPGTEGCIKTASEWFASRRLPGLNDIWVGLSSLFAA